MGTHRRIIGGIATVPARQDVFRQVVEAIAPRLDHLYVYLSGYVAYLQALPANTTQIKVAGDPYGDAGKFAGLSAAGNAYYLTFDDDLAYPPDYVDALIDGIERYECKAVVSFHGRNFGAFPIQNYYRSATQRFYCLRQVRRDHRCQVPGTGVMGFHTSALRLTLHDFPSRNMADVHMAVALRRQQVPAYVLAHSEGWIRHLPVDHSRTIYRRHLDDCAEQTRRLNEAYAEAYA